MRLTGQERVQTASSEVIRDINRRTLLNLIRIRHPISRADLSRLSGLQRSTVSLIVEELVDENWVIEGPTGRLPRGRRPTFLRLNEDRVIIGVDIRPAQTAVALANAHGKFTLHQVMPTPSDPKVAVDELIRRIRPIQEMARGKKIEGIGVSLPGRFNSGHLMFAPNLKWPDFDLREPIARATGLDVEMENAANACVLAAVWFDRMEHCGNLVALTVSEGIGAGLLINGQLARGLNNMAGEFGHVPLDSSGPVCGCGSRGCWEVFASNRAALRYYHESAARPLAQEGRVAGGQVRGVPRAVRGGLRGSKSLAQNGLASLSSAAASGLSSFEDLLSLADQGDARAENALETMARYLGRGMRMIVAGLAPERIIIIGDLTRSWHRFGPILEAEVRAQVLPGGVPPQLIPAYEDGLARLRGTIALVLQKHFGPSNYSPTGPK